MSTEDDDTDYWVFHGQGDCKRVTGIQAARELRDALMDEGDYAVILDRDNREVS